MLIITRIVNHIGVNVFGLSEGILAQEALYWHIRPTTTTNKFTLVASLGCQFALKRFYFALVSSTVGEARVEAQILDVAISHA